jgi:hypothetical protein
MNAREVDLPATPPVASLAGYLMGNVFLSAQTELAMTRLVLIRLPAAGRALSVRAVSVKPPICANPRPNNQGAHP